MKLTWNQFQIIHENCEEYMFEVLCRRVFKNMFPNNKVWNHAKPNNPGLEMPPITYITKDGDTEKKEVIGFQAKYFKVDKIGSTQIKQIQHSLDIAVKYYVDERIAASLAPLTTVYLFTNLYLDSMSSGYKQLEESLKMRKVELKLICNNDLLDEIAKQPEYIRQDFFGADSHFNEWNIYYKEIIQYFEHTPKEHILGNEPLSTAYITPHAEEGELLKLVENWFAETESGVLLIHGEAGDGKSTFCKKAVYEYAKQRYLKDARGVFCFTLNDSESHLIDGKGIQLQNVLHMEGEDESLVKLKEADELLIFLDGFDEIKLMLQEIGISDYRYFYEKINIIAHRRGIHFVITSRTTAIKDSLNSSLLSYQFKPLSYIQQKNWIYCDDRYEKRRYIDYWENTLDEICKNVPNTETSKALYELLKIPFIFRMVVHQEYRITGHIENKAKLYEDLFDKTIHRREIRTIADTTEDILRDNYKELAYSIWCYDDDMGIADDSMAIEKDLLLYSYYLKEKSTDKQLLLGFVHRSIYQYFFALYVYDYFINIVSIDDAIHFLGLFGCRRIEVDILNLINQIYYNNTENTDGKISIQVSQHLSNACKLVFQALAKTQVVVAESNKLQRNPETRIQRRKNHIFCNILNICFCFDSVEEFNRQPQIKELLEDFNNLQLYIQGNENVFLDLSHLQLSGKEIIGGVLRYVDFSFTDLSESNLMDTDLERSIFDNTTCRNTIFSRYPSVNNELNCNLKYTSFKDTDMSGAELIAMDLSSVIMSCVSFKNATLVGSCFKDIKCSDIDFHNANLSNTNFSNATLDNINFRDIIGKNIIMDKATVKKTNMNNSYMPYAKLVGTHFYNLQMCDAIINHSNLFDVVFHNSIISRSLMKNTILVNAKLVHTTISNSDLYKARMNNCELSNVDATNVNFYGSELKNAKMSGINLKGSTLCFADISFTVLSGAKMDEVNMSYSNFTHSQLDGCILTSSNMSFCDFKHANCKQTDMKLADMRCADLKYCDLTKADMRGIDIRFADMKYSVMKEANIREYRLKKIKCEGTDLRGVDLNDTIKFSPDLKEAKI